MNLDGRLFFVSIAFAKKEVLLAKILSLLFAVLMLFGVINAQDALARLHELRERDPEGDSGSRTVPSLCE